MKTIIFSLLVSFFASSCGPSSSREASCKCPSDCFEKDQHCGVCTHECSCKIGK